MQKGKSGQPKLRTNHGVASSGAKKSTTKTGAEAVKPRLRRSSIPPVIPGLYAPVSAREDSPEAVQEGAKHEEEDVRRSSILQQRQKLDAILEERRRALAAQEAAKKARAARQQAQKEKRQREDYGASRNPEPPRAKRPPVPSDLSKQGSSVVVELKPRARPKYVNKRVHLIPMSRAG